MLSKMRNQKGFTLIELMIVVAIIGILAAIAIPNFLDLKDKAIFGTAKANVDVLRSVLASYAADSPTNRYPTSLTYADLSTSTGLLSEANLPAAQTDAKWVAGSFTYVSNGTTFLISVQANDRSQDGIYGMPSGITPNSYPWN